MTDKKHKTTSNVPELAFFNVSKDGEKFLNRTAEYKPSIAQTGYHSAGFNSGKHYLAMHIGEPTAAQVSALKRRLLSGETLTPADIREMGIYSPSRAIAKIRHDEEIPVKTRVYVTEEEGEEGEEIESVRRTEYSVIPEEIARFKDERQAQIDGLRAVVAGNRKRRAGRDAFNFFFEVTKAHPEDAELQAAIIALYPYMKEFANFNIRELTDGVTRDIYVTRSPYIEPSAANDDDYEWQEAE